jgi:hypothetical protein
VQREQASSTDDGLSLDSLGLSNIKFMGKYHVRTLVQYCGSEAQTMVDLRLILVTFCRQKMA